MGEAVLVTPEQQLHLTVERQSAEIAALRIALHQVAGGEQETGCD